MHYEIAQVGWLVGAMLGAVIYVVWGFIKDIAQGRGFRGTSSAPKAADAKSPTDVIGTGHGLQADNIAARLPETPSPSGDQPSHATHEAVSERPPVADDSDTIERLATTNVSKRSYRNFRRGWNRLSIVLSVVGGTVVGISAYRDFVPDLVVDWRLARANHVSVSQLRAKRAGLLFRARELRDHAEDAFLTFPPLTDRYQIERDSLVEQSERLNADADSIARLLDPYFGFFGDIATDSIFAVILAIITAIASALAVWLALLVVGQVSGWVVAGFGNSPSQLRH